MNPEVVEVVFEGWAIGSIYAMVALGFVVIYKTSKVLNFAHGAVGAAGGLVMASLVTDGGLGISQLSGANPLRGLADSSWGWSLNLVLAMALTALIAIVIERVVVRPMIGRSQFTLIILTIGLSVALQRFVDKAPIARALRVPWGAELFLIDEARIPKSAVASIVMGLFAIVLIAAFNKTKVGLSARAVASDVEVALSTGIDVGKVYRLTWAISAALATAAAVAFSFSPRGVGTINTGATPELFFRALPVIAIGGWDSYRGAYTAGIAIGLIQAATGRAFAEHTDLLGAGYPRVIPYVLMVIVLLVRPAGLYGQRTIRRV